MPMTTVDVSGLPVAPRQPPDRTRSEKSLRSPANNSNDKSSNSHDTLSRRFIMRVKLLVPSFHAVEMCIVGDLTPPLAAADATAVLLLLTLPQPQQQLLLLLSAVTVVGAATAAAAAVAAAATADTAAAAVSLLRL